jgi:hypothetical protein
MNTPPTHPALTLSELQHIHQEVKAAGAEFSEMHEVHGDIRNMWEMPRR